MTAKNIDDCYRIYWPTQLCAIDRIQSEIFFDFRRFISISTHITENH